MTINPSTGVITAPSLDVNPKFGFAFGVGSTGADAGRSVATDSSDNVYIAGVFSGTVTFGSGPAAVSLTSATGTDGFVAKYTPTGQLIWVKPADGAFVDRIAVDATGNVVATGVFQNTVDFDPGPVSFPLTSAGDEDIFVWKLDTNGNFVWARRMGGSARDEFSDVAVDAQGNAYAVGNFRGTATFDTGSGTTSLTSLGADDVFVGKYDSTGNLTWLRQIGGVGSAFHQGPSQGGREDIAVDPTGNVVVTGTLLAPSISTLVPAWIIFPRPISLFS
jgi:hypothetical protein